MWKLQNEMRPATTTMKLKAEQLALMQKQTHCERPNLQPRDSLKWMEQPKWR